jgi:hypothetical protein
MNSALTFGAPESGRQSAGDALHGPARTAMRGLRDAVTAAPANHVVYAPWNGPRARGKLNDGRRGRRARAGSVHFTKRGIVHGFRNDAQEAASCLCILTPGVLGPGYFRDIAGLLSQVAPDPAKTKEIMLRYGLHPAQ